MCWLSEGTGDGITFDQMAIEQSNLGNGTIWFAIDNNDLHLIHRAINK